MQPSMQAVPVVDKKAWIVCICGGKGEIVTAPFLLQSMLVGTKPEITPVVVIMCRKCNEEICSPFMTIGAQIKEAS